MFLPVVLATASILSGCYASSSAVGNGIIIGPDAKFLILHEGLPGWEGKRTGRFRVPLYENSHETGVPSASVLCIGGTLDFLVERSHSAR